MHSKASTIQWEVTGFKRRPGRPWINWRDIVNKDLQRMGPGKRLKHQLETDRFGVNVWPYASAMLDATSQVKGKQNINLL